MNKVYHHICQHGYLSPKCDTCNLAAENAELRTKLAALESARQFAEELVEDLRKQRDKFAMMAREITCVWCGHQFDSTIQSQADHLYDHAKRCEKHPIRKAEAKLAEAVELLRPFADESNEWISWVYDECNPVIGEQGDAERAMFTVGDLRKAAAFVAENGKVKS